MHTLKEATYKIQCIYFSDSLFIDSHQFSCQNWMCFGGHFILVASTPLAITVLFLYWCRREILKAKINGCLIYTVKGCDIIKQRITNCGLLKSKLIQMHCLPNSIYLYTNIGIPFCVLLPRSRSKDKVYWYTFWLNIQKISNHDISYYC